MHLKSAGDFSYSSEINAKQNTSNTTLGVNVLNNLNMNKKLFSNVLFTFLAYSQLVYVKIKEYICFKLKPQMRSANALLTP